MITDPHELSNAFNRHFTDIGPNLAANINPSRVSFRDFIESCESTFELELLTIDGLRKLVNDIPVGKAGGIEGGGGMKKKTGLKGGASKKISSVRGGGGHSKNYPKIL